MKRILPILLVLFLLLSGCGVPAQPSGPTPTSNVAPLEALGTPMPTYGEVARALIRDFSNIGTRTAGSSGEKQAADYITQVFQAVGYSPETRPFTAENNGQAINSANVVAVKDGTSMREIIVGAHYDSSDAGPGADDNASGLAVMLEAARMVASLPTPYTIRFIAFGGGNSGRLGSYAYLNNMSQDEFENVIAMVDLDSLVAGDVAYVVSDEGTQAVARDWALAWAVGNGFDLQTIKNADMANVKVVSDYAPFRDAGIPYAYFISTDWNLGDKKGDTQVDSSYGDHGVIRNTKYDTLDYLDKTFPGRVDQRLNLFVSVLYNFLIQFEVPIQ
jgi:Zn-dependent M28 family amino/carboxypeptidase